ncbi:uncharacterized protein A1O9_10860 [Exophiala aquamarina CBS 119918]|uniref:Enoyl reductase (ER) domain-containing protein n=1 Tax=Exophiala aquamarina CBS 119918 TaxID=1182545 RepID=A0A072NYL2_9EURO|nr:uncharacterized protein A1O9_10860 [Exophiala aquamarina CBS 119918]KEF52954.1 hypothetical protein A1O9_10860 [Exophiala aquamarina CBS 119918]
MPTNRAAWLDAKSTTLVVHNAPFPIPGEDEIVVKNACVAINPVDYKLQDWDFLNLRYPAILGCEVAGEIVAIGDQVRNFQTGQRVIGNCHSSVTKDYKNAGFQEYTVLSSSLAVPIPDEMAFSAAVVLPVAVSTASAALFDPGNFGIAVPQMAMSDSPTPAASDLLPPKDTSAVLIWGGSTSVGCVAIQLARAAGLKVITTTSKHNFGLCKALGAHEVFDREADSAVDEIVAALNGKVLVGALNAVGAQNTLQTCIDILVRTESRKLVATTLPVEEGVERRGVQVNFFHGLSILQNGLASTIWNEFLPQALQDGTLVPKPDAVIVGHGLDDIQKGLNKAREGYSASKLVVTL